MKYLLFILICALALDSFATKYVFWSDCKRLGYDLAANPGPNLSVAPENVFEDKIVCKSDNGVGDYPVYTIYIYRSPGLYNEHNCILPFALNKMRGSITRATLRGEIADVASRPTLGGTYHLIMGVADAYCPWSFPLRKEAFDSCNSGGLMSYIFRRPWDPIFDTSTITIPAGRQPTDTISPLAKTFYEIDITPAVQWILDNNDSMKTHAYFIHLGGLLSSVGRMRLYGFPYQCTGGLDTVYNNVYKDPHSWTQDGNTVHIVVEGTLNPTSPSERLISSAPFWDLSVNPNPFNLATTLRYVVPHGVTALVAVYSASGQLIKSLPASGRGSFAWNASGLPSGVYYCVLKNGAKRIVRPMVFLK